MKKCFVTLALVVTLYACSGNGANNAATGDTTNNTGLTNPTAIDTTKHPTGVDNSSVISTDTAAANIQNSYKKLDSIQKQKSSR
jgi:hypothetical protein